MRAHFRCRLSAPGLCSGHERCHNLAHLCSAALPCLPELEGGAFPSSGGQPQSRAGIGMGGRGGGGGDMPNMGSNPGMGRGGRGGGRGFGGPGGGAGGSDPMARYYKPTFSKDPWSGLLQQHGQPPKMQQQQQQQQQQKEIPADPCPAPPNGGEEASKAQPPKQTLSQILAKVGFSTLLLAAQLV
eukprot:116222-Pelagomonas_calceolata.AAC.1